MHKSLDLNVVSAPEWSPDARARAIVERCHRAFYEELSEKGSTGHREFGACASCIAAALREREQPRREAAEVVAQRMKALDDMFDAWSLLWSGELRATEGDMPVWRDWLHGWLIGALRDAGIAATLHAADEQPRIYVCIQCGWESRPMKDGEGVAHQCEQPRRSVSRSRSEIGI